MNPELWIALQITLIGMSIVFGCILLLWLLMTLLVRWTSERSNTKTVVEPDTMMERRQRAALTAVAVALAHQSSSEPKPFPLPEKTIVSAWQAVTRANHLRRRGPLR
jgi:Na+-transporting methylmalonyl-CoA/oxaloacetate decarboxylase gamma subunit